VSMQSTSSRRLRSSSAEFKPTAESLEFGKTVDQLKPLVGLICRPPPTRKGDLVECLTKTMLDPAQLRKLYKELDPSGQAAVQEAVHADDGTLDMERFAAKYGRPPDLGNLERWGRDRSAVALRLFFPGYEHVLPSDLQALLAEFVRKPKELQVTGDDNLPVKVQRPYVDLGSSYGTPDREEVELTVRPTAAAALHDVKAVLRLIDAGQVRVGDKTRRPSQAALKAVTAVLADGDFYGEEDQSQDEWDPVADLTMKAFAWPMLLQAAGLAASAGTKLQLTEAGRKATTRPAHEIIRPLWDKWLKTTLLDEYNRIDVIKGQQGVGRGGLTAMAPRRQAVVDVLKQCPVKKWISISELFRLLKASAKNFVVSHDPWKLYIAEQRYGSLGYDARHTWEALQGRFTLAFLFEYGATLGLIDVAYIPPADSRNDFHDRWGTDDLSCLSRYDGLMFVRINALGAWCLGRADRYDPETVGVERVLQVLPNLDVVARHPPLRPADRLFLDRFAERNSEAVWHLSTAKGLAAVEEGLTVAELRDFLAARCQESLPQTVTVFVDDLENKAGQLEDQGAARLIGCRDAIVAQTLAHDRRLRPLCQLAGERLLVFRAADEAAVRRGLRELGYVLARPK